MKHVNNKNERDKLVIEAAIRKFGPYSRVEIHKLTHLHHSTVSRLVRELLDEGRILEAGRANNSIGRKQILLRLNEEHRFVVGVGFDDENVLAAIIDLHGRTERMVRQVTCLDRGTEGLLDQLLSCARTAIEQAGVDIGSLVAIGVAGSGLINSREGVFVMSSTMPDFIKQVPLQSIFEKEFDVPTVVENITRAKTVAERVLGAGAMADDMVYVEYGKTGIGAGIFLDGKLVQGSGCVAGEFGHTHMIEDGPACKCGSFGCLEALAGAAALETKIRKAIADGGGSETMTLANGDASKISGWMVLEAAKRGDKTCSALVEQVGNYLGLGLANIVNLFNPLVVVLDQRLSRAGQGLLDQITKVVKRQSLSYSTKHLIIRFGKLGSEASVLGVGSIALDRHFEIPALKPPRFMIETISAPFRLDFTSSISRQKDSTNAV